MREIKKVVTREEVTGYEACDGTVFRTKEECQKYEESAKFVAKKAAWHYLVADVRGSYDLFNSDDEYLAVFDIPDMEAYRAIANWANLTGVYDNKDFTPDYVGKRVAFLHNWDGYYFSTHFATEEAMMELYTKEIKACFADKPAPTT